jgi:hypothetical protein
MAEPNWPWSLGCCLPAARVVVEVLRAFDIEAQSPLLLDVVDVRPHSREQFVEHIRQGDGHGATGERPRSASLALGNRGT